MKILMDTHAFLWFVEGDKRLSAWLILDSGVVKNSA